MASPQKFLPPRPGKLETAEQEVYYREAARLYKQEVGIPLMLVGGIRSYEVAEELVRDGTADYISMTRPLICEPGLVKRWREGDRRTTECLICPRARLCASIVPAPFKDTEPIAMSTV